MRWNQGFKYVQTRSLTRLLLPVQTDGFASHLNDAAYLLPKVMAAGHVGGESAKKG